MLTALAYKKNRHNNKHFSQLFSVQLSSQLSALCFSFSSQFWRQGTPNDIATTRSPATTPTKHDTVQPFLLAGSPVQSRLSVVVVSIVLQPFPVQFVATSHSSTPSPHNSLTHSLTAKPDWCWFVWFVVCVVLLFGCTARQLQRTTLVARCRLRLESWCVFVCLCVWSPSSLTLLSPSLSSLHSALCGPLCRSVVFSSCGLPRAMLKLG